MFPVPSELVVSVVCAGDLDEDQICDDTDTDGDGLSDIFEGTDDTSDTDSDGNGLSDIDEADPAVPNDSEAHRAENRRVAFTILERAPHK